MELFYDQRLVDKPVRFWKILFTAYCKDLKQLQIQLESIKVTHRDVENWLNRLYDPYHFNKDLSSIERRWLEALSACLHVAVSLNDADLVNFLLEQDPATSSKSFKSIGFNRTTMLELAIKKCQFQIVDAFIQHEWLSIPGISTMDLPLYMRVITLAAKIPREAPGRAEITCSITSISCRDLTTIRTLVTQAVRRNNVNLAEMVFSNEVHQGFFEEIMTISSYPQRPTSLLALCAKIGHREITHYLLEHARRHGKSVMRHTIAPYHDIKTTTLMELFRMTIYEPIDEPVLAELLEYSKHQRLEQLHVAVNRSENAIDMLQQFFEHIDVNSHASIDDDKVNDNTTLGEHALLCVVNLLDVACTRHLLEDKEVRIVEKKTFQRPTNQSHWGRNLSFVLEHEAEVEVRKLLSKYDMIASKDRTSIWPRTVTQSIS